MSEGRNSRRRWNFINFLAFLGWKRPSARRRQPEDGPQRPHELTPPTAPIDIVDGGELTSTTCDSSGEKITSRSESELKANELQKPTTKNASSTPEMKLIPVTKCRSAPALPLRRTNASYAQLRVLLARKKSHANYGVPAYLRELHSLPSIRRLRGEIATPLPPQQVPKHLWPLLKAMGILLPESSMLAGEIEASEMRSCSKTNKDSPSLDLTWKEPIVSELKQSKDDGDDDDDEIEELKRWFYRHRWHMYN